MTPTLELSLAGDPCSTSEMGRILCSEIFFSRLCGRSDPNPEFPNAHWGYADLTVKC
jgi:hypothetical protein